MGESGCRSRCLFVLMALVIPFILSACTAEMMQALGETLQEAAQGDAICATLSAQPAKTKACPTTIYFPGKITVNDPTVKVVQYQFATSDGSVSALQTLYFDQPGTQEVGISWDITQPCRGWAQLQVVYPTAVDSDNAHFRVSSYKAEESATPATPSPLQLRPKPVLLQKSAPAPAPPVLR